MCKCNVKICRAACCHNTPIERGYLSAYSKRIANKVLEVVPMADDVVVPITDYDMEKNKCPFLNEHYRCNIYDVRPSVCRKFGVDTGESKFLRCKFLGQ